MQSHLVISQERDTTSSEYLVLKTNRENLECNDFSENLESENSLTLECNELSIQISNWKRQLLLRK
jgi:hypothetical protein